MISMHSADNIIKFIQSTYGVKTYAADAIVQCISQNNNFSEPLSHALMVKMIDIVPAVDPELLVKVTQLELNSNPSKWGLVSKVSAALFSAGAYDFTSFYQDMVANLDTPSNYSIWDRLLLLVECIKQNKRDLKSITVEDIEPYWQNLLLWQQYVIKDKIYEAVSHGRLLFGAVTPMIVATIREGNIRVNSDGRNLVGLSNKYPELEGAIAESLILNRSLPNKNAGNIRPTVRLTERDSCMSEFWSKYAPETIEWQRCAIAVLLSNDPKQMDPLIDMGETKWPAAWAAITSQYTLYQDLVGGGSMTESQIIDAFIHGTKAGQPQYPVEHMLDDISP